MYFLELLILAFIAFAIIYKLFSQIGIEDDEDIAKHKNNRITIQAEEISSNDINSNVPLTNEELKLYTDNIYLYSSIKELSDILPNFNFRKFVNNVKKVFHLLIENEEKDELILKEIIKLDSIDNILNKLRYYRLSNTSIINFKIISIEKKDNLIIIIFLFETAGTSRYWHFEKDKNNITPNWYLFDITNEI
ncbi:MAG: hypothetical protein U1E31_02665 [Rickettsiales bacterium]